MALSKPLLVTSLFSMGGWLGMSMLYCLRIVGGKTIKTTKQKGTEGKVKPCDEKTEEKVEIEAHSKKVQ